MQLSGEMVGKITKADQSRANRNGLCRVVERDRGQTQNRLASELGIMMRLFSTSSRWLIPDKPNAPPFSSIVHVKKGPRHEDQEGDGSRIR
jgi:hypothetical protein